MTVRWWLPGLTARDAVDPPPAPSMRAVIEPPPEPVTVIVVEAEQRTFVAAVRDTACGFGAGGGAGRRVTVCLGRGAARRV